MPIAEGVSVALTTTWAFLIAFGVFVYVVLDGFDLGLGLLFGVEPDRHDRDVTMTSVAPVWDGNETWLISGGGLFAAFSLAYGGRLVGLADAVQPAGRLRTTWRDLADHEDRGTGARAHARAGRAARGWRGCHPDAARGDDEAHVILRRLG